MIRTIYDGQAEIEDDSGFMKITDEDGNEYRLCPNTVNAVYAVLLFTKV
jgi:hypothetical protein